MQGAHIGSLAVLHGAHILYDQLGGDSAGGNQAVHQAALCHHIGKGFAVDFSHHLAVVQLRSIHCQNNVGFVQTGQRHKGIHIGNAFLRQQLAVGAIALNDERTGDFFAHILAAGGIVVNYGNVHVHLAQFFDEIIRHAGSAHHHDIVGALLENTQAAEELFQFLRGGHQVDCIPFFQGKTTGGDGDLFAACHGTDQHFDPHVAVQVAQLQAGQGVALGQAVFHQFKALLAELFQLERIGEAQHAGDLARRGLFGVNDHRKAQFLAHKAQLLFIFRVADARNGMAGVQLFGNQAGQDVDLIAVRCGNQQIGAAFKRFGLHFIAAAVAGHAAHIADIADIIHNGRVAVNYNNVVLICAELLGQRAAHFAQAHNHDLHSVSSFPPDPYGIQLLRYRFRDDAKQQSSLSRCF